MKNETKGWRRVVYATAILAAGVGVPPAHAATMKQQVAALVKHDKKQTRQIHALQKVAAMAEARAEDAQDNYAFLSQCLLIQPAGSADMLNPSSTASFVQGSIDGVVPDLFQWLPIVQRVVVPDGPDYLVLLDPDCVAQPDPAPRLGGSQWHPRKFKIATPR